LHIPFCERKCIYCDFYSIENLGQREQFVDLLLREIEMKLAAYPELEGRTLQTIFFGGGTPSLLLPGELERIVTALRRHFQVAEVCEFTLECNPGTVDIEKLRAYREIGANRLSFGVQSFDADELKFLGRIHDAEQAEEAVGLSRKAGFDNVSIDLIFSLPNQTEETLTRTLKRAIALGTEHISAYNLIVEHGTPLYRLVQKKQVIELDSDRAASLFELVQDSLDAAGYEQYEISNYARSEDTRAQHNLVYWDGAREWVAFGPSAHEFLSGERAWNVSSLDQYADMIGEAKLPRINSERLSAREQRTETLYLQLRSTGLRLTEFKARFGEDLLEQDEAQYLMADELLVADGDRLRLTRRGYRFCDGIVGRLIREPREFVIQ
jgi:oxygen-independent coproporphyrinogen-3 oxidase